MTAVRFHATSDLPVGVHVAMLQGETEVVWLLDRTSDLDVVCAALSQAATEHASRSWVYVGDVQEQHGSAPAGGR